MYAVRIYSLHRCEDEILQGRAADGGREPELEGGARGSMDGVPEEGWEGEARHGVLERCEALGEAAPGHEVEGTEVEDLPAEGVEGGGRPRLADEGEAEDEVVNAEAAEDVH